jgi:hypothetical protein
MFVQGDVCIYHGPKAELNGAVVVVDCVIPEDGAVVCNHTNSETKVVTGFLIDPKNLRLKPPDLEDRQLKG